jgi:hypothetical protein
MLSSDETTCTVGTTGASDPLRDSGSVGRRVFETPIVVQWDCDGETVVTGGTLQDLSSTGIRLVLEKPIPLRKRIEFRIRTDESEFDWQVSAEVCWLRARGPDQWLLGCSFTSEFSETALDKLAVAGYVNRRKDPRLPISLAALARQELMSEAIGVRFEDYSRGGCRILSPSPLSVGERVMLIVAGPDDETFSLSARAVWQRQVAGGYSIGCCFINNSSYGHLSRIVRQQQKGVETVELAPQEVPAKKLGKHLSDFVSGAVRSLSRPKKGQLNGNRGT